MTEITQAAFVHELEKIAYTPPMPGAGGAMGILPPDASPGPASPSTGLTTASAAAPKINMKRGGSPGATAMAGMSVHCDKCFAEIKGPTPPNCPKCGNRINSVRDIKSAPEEKKNGNGGEETNDESPTGGDEELSDGGPVDSGKYAAASALAHPLIQKLKAVLALSGGLKIGIEGKKLFNPKPLYKHGGVTHKRGSRLASFNLHRRGGNYNSVQEGLDRISKATAKHTKGLERVV